MQPRAQAVPRSLQCNDREGMKIPVIGSPRDFVYPGSLSSTLAITSTLRVASCGRRQ